MLHIMLSAPCIRATLIVFTLLLVLPLYYKSFIAVTTDVKQGQRKLQTQLESSSEIQNQNQNQNQNQSQNVSFAHPTSTPVPVPLPTISTTSTPKTKPNNSIAISTEKPLVTIATVACGLKKRGNFLVLVKSAILFSRDVKLSFIIFKDNQTDFNQTESLDSQLAKLKTAADSLGYSFSYQLRESWFPASKKVDWRNMYRTNLKFPCPAQRLFLPSLLPEVDSLIYLDADTIFLSNIKTETWDTFKNSHGNQWIAGMVAENEPPSQNFYTLKSKIPFYGARGLNSGVILMNLTRMRKVRFEDAIRKIPEEFGERIVNGDQDILNIYFARNQHLLFPMSCAFNFRYEHCACTKKKEKPPECGCRAGENEGLSIIHGTWNGFDKAPLKVINDQIKNYDLTSGVKNPTFIQLLLQKIKKGWEKLKQDKNNSCLGPKKAEMYLQKFQTYTSAIS